MMTTFAGIPATVLALTPITNPIGGLAAFTGLAANSTPTAVRSQAWKTGIYVSAIPAVFTVSGPLIMYFFGFDLPSLQIAGSLVITHSGFPMLENKHRATHEGTQHAAFELGVSLSPMALPLIVGLGSIDVVITLAAHNMAIGFHVGIALRIVVTAAVIALLLRYGTPWIDELGATDVDAIMHIMGFLILTIGVELTIHGVRVPQLF